MQILKVMIYLYLTHSLCSRHKAGAGMAPSPNVETWEILLPSLDIVYGHCGVGVITPRDHHSVCVGIRDDTGRAVIITNFILTSQHLTLTLHHI